VITHALPATTVLALAACTTGVPAEPSFQQDVAPILAARCARCHGVPQIGGAPTSFRLTYSDIPSVEFPGEHVPGAGAKAGRIVDLVVAEQMPPRFPLDDEQRDVLRVWVSLRPDLSSPAPRGFERPGNRPPALSLSPPEVRDDGSDVELHVRTVTWRFEVRDPDGDLVGGYLRAGEHVVGELHSGRGELVLTITKARNEPQSIPPGDYPLAAWLDDGGQLFELVPEPSSVTIGALP
jgi:hypothetical protein